MSVARQDIYDKVRDVLVDALGVDEDEITPAATLVGDLVLNYSIIRNATRPLVVNAGIFPRTKFLREDITFHTLATAMPMEQIYAASHFALGLDGFLSPKTMRLGIGVDAQNVLMSYSEGLAYLVSVPNAALEAQQMPLEYAGATYNLSQNDSFFVATKTSLSTLAEAKAPAQVDLADVLRLERILNLDRGWLSALQNFTVPVGKTRHPLLEYA